MGRPRGFDHERARELRASGMRVADIAKLFGVADVSVYIATSDSLRERTYARAKRARRWVGVCLDCGGEATRSFGYAHRHGRCMECAAIARTTTVRESTLLCSACREWKPDVAFGRRSAERFATRRHRERVCLVCGAAQKRLLRARVVHDPAE